MVRGVSARQQAIDEIKKHGNPQNENAIALAIVHLADVIAAKKDGLTK